MLMTFQVVAKACSSCIYRKDSPLDLNKLEDEARDPHIGFAGYRICHNTDSLCCRGFWNAHKDHFPAGQVAQRLNLVEFVLLENANPRDEDVMGWEGLIQ